MQTGHDATSPIMGTLEFQAFYRANVAMVFGYALRLCGGHRQRAEDLTQDAWLAMTRRLSSGDRQVADPRWLVTVVRNKYIDEHRRSLRGDRAINLLATATRADPGEQVPDDPNLSDLLGTIDQLEVAYRVVLLLRYVDGLGVPEIATIIGRNVTATNSLLARARIALRQRTGAPR